MKQGLHTWQAVSVLPRHASWRFKGTAKPNELKGLEKGDKGPAPLFREQSIFFLPSDTFPRNRKS